ncbi:unnamed protein product [Pelagomonas calceolata]|uniref:U-box domain-containing protein n=1 Tax=Pelagomonas calceolata TaxID=35677 RepID=A0A8J2SMH8_9STRA|nr:unnamed protein product [Pelagomonas calceolata]
MPDAMTTLLANAGLSDLERRLRDEAIDETTILDLDEGDMKEIGLKMGPRRKLLTAIREAKDRRTTPGADWARSPPPPPPPPASTKLHPPAKPAPGLTVGAKARLRKKAAPAPVTPAPAPEAPAASNSDALECPITYELFVDPVTLEGDGVVYEREAIENWLRRGNLTSPATGVALKATQTKLIPNAAVRRRAAAARSRTARAHLDAKTQVADDATARIQALEAENAALRDRLRLSVDRETEAAAKLREATRENARLQKDAKSANNYKNRAKKATARADELDRVLASVLAHSQHLEAELATLRNMPRLLVRNTTAPPVTPGDGDSAY